MLVGPGLIHLPAAAFTMFRNTAAMRAAGRARGCLSHPGLGHGAWETIGSLPVGQVKVSLLQVQCRSQQDPPPPPHSHVTLVPRPLFSFPTPACVALCMAT
jgi:hypothetical protein